MVPEPSSVAQTPLHLSNYVRELLQTAEVALSLMRGLEKKQHKGHFERDQTLVPL